MFNNGKKSDESVTETGDFVRNSSENARKLDKESAESIFRQFCRDWHIKTDTSKFNSEDTTAYEEAKERIMEAIERGNLDIKDSKTLEYTFMYPDDLNCSSVKIRRPRGSTYMAADEGKKDKDVKKMFYMLAEMTGKNTEFYSNVEAVDLKVIMGVTTLFFGS